MSNDVQTGAAPHIGDAAPQFRARSTMGPVSLDNFRGRWLMLMSHPGDFTPVCTSEFIAFAKAQAEFADLGCAIAALSVDSLFAHLAWVRAIQDQTGIAIGFPIIEDPTLAIARGYGMVAANAGDAATVRASFFIDPDGIIRAITYYPATIGRSVEESLRMVRALQEADRTGCLAPADWTPGDAMLLPPAIDADAVLAGEKADWFYRFAANGSVAGGAGDV